MEASYYFLIITSFFFIAICCIIDRRINPRRQIGERSRLITSRSFSYNTGYASPPIIYITNIDKENIETGLECPICLENLENEDIVSTLNCRHVFHRDCIYKWFYKRRCPVCRNLVTYSVNSYANLV
jgi:hypothetical protein